MYLVIVLFTPYCVSIVSISYRRDSRLLNLS